MSGQGDPRQDLEVRDGREQQPIDIGGRPDRLVARHIRVRLQADKGARGTSSPLDRADPVDDESGAVGVVPSGAQVRVSAAVVEVTDEHDLVQPFAGPAEIEL